MSALRAVSTDAVATAAVAAAAADPRRDAEAALTRAYDGVLDVLGRLGYPVATDDNYRETAGRAARAMLEMVHPVADIERELGELLARTFPARGEASVVISRHNTCFGMCPHHLLPVSYRVSVAYLPMTRVLGISKLSRMITLLARRPVLQEDLTHELADVLSTRLESRGSAVLIEGAHLCMAARGVEVRDATVVTSAMRGVFLDQTAARQEFLALATQPRGAGLLLG